MTTRGSAIRTAAQQVNWLKAPVVGFAGEIGASLAISGERWEALGADFEEVEDGTGDRPRLAVGSFETVHSEMRFGVLDYGEEITYVLVPSLEERGILTASLLRDLKAVGWLNDGEVIDTVGRDAGAKPVVNSGNLLLEIQGKIVPNYAATMVALSEGDVVRGKVVRIDEDEVLVDIGYLAEGIIPASELSVRSEVNPAQEVELGEEIEALVLTKEDAEGRLILSKKRARFEKAWRQIELAAMSGESIEGTVIEVIKGGLIVDVGVRGFLPASLVDIRRVRDLDEFLGQMLGCKVIELNRARNSVVLSRRAVLEEARRERCEQILRQLEPGQEVEGKVTKIVPFGVFVDLGGIEGLIHISELSWGHVNHPSEVVAVGDIVRIKVLDIDRDRQRINLSRKQIERSTDGE